MSWTGLLAGVVNVALGLAAHHLGFRQGRTRGRIDAKTEMALEHIRFLEMCNREMSVMRRRYLEQMQVLEGRTSTTEERTVQ